MDVMPYRYLTLLIFKPTFPKRRLLFRIDSTPYDNGLIGFCLNQIAKYTCLDLNLWQRISSLLG